jgi:hypothetical protein
LYSQWRKRGNLTETKHPAFAGAGCSTNLSPFRNNPAGNPTDANQIGGFTAQDGAGTKRKKRPPKT